MNRGAVLGIRRTPTDVERGGMRGVGRRNHRGGDAAEREVLRQLPAINQSR